MPTSDVHGDKFFINIGCMDGRVQHNVAEFGRNKFQAQYGDTITEAGLVGLLANGKATPEILKSMRDKIFISLNKHHSKGIVVHGHQDCAGNPVPDERQKQDILATAERLREMTGGKTAVVPVFVKKENNDWVVEPL